MAAIPQMASFLAPKWPTFYFHWKYLFFKNGQPTRQNINWLDRQELWNINDTVHVSTGTGTRPIEHWKITFSLSLPLPGKLKIPLLSIKLHSSTFWLISKRWGALDLLMVTVECEPLFWKRFCGNVLIAWVVTVTFSYPDNSRRCNQIAFQHFSTSYLGSFSRSLLG